MRPTLVVRNTVERLTPAAAAALMRLYMVTVVAPCCRGARMRRCARMVDEGLTRIREEVPLPISWDERRAKRFVLDGPPTGWPKNIRPISDVGLGLFGIEPNTNRLNWDGKEIILRDRVRLEWPERLFTFLIGVGTFGYFIMELGKLLKWWGG